MGAAEQNARLQDAARRHSADPAFDRSADVTRCAPDAAQRVALCEAVRCRAGAHVSIKVVRVRLCGAASRMPHGVRDTLLLRSFDRVRETRFGRAGLERLLLAFMRRPAGEPEDIEGGTDAAIGIG